MDQICRIPAATKIFKQFLSEEGEEALFSFYTAAQHLDTLTKRLGADHADVGADGPGTLKTFFLNEAEALLSSHLSDEAPLPLELSKKAMSDIVGGLHLVADEKAPSLDMFEASIKETRAELEDKVYVLATSR